MGCIYQVQNKIVTQMSGLNIMSTNQTPANVSANQMPLTPGKKVSLDALFQSAGATPKSSAIDHSTPIHHTGQPANGINHRTVNNEHMDKNIEKTKNLKNMFGLSGNYFKSKINFCSIFLEAKFKP